MPTLSERVESEARELGAAAVEAASRLFFLLLHSVRAHAGQELLLVLLAVVTRWLLREHLVVVVLGVFAGVWLVRSRRKLDSATLVAEASEEEVKANFTALFAAAAACDVDEAFELGEPTSASVELVEPATVSVAAVEPATASVAAVEPATASVAAAEPAVLDAAPFSSVARAIGEWAATGHHSPVLSPRTSLSVPTSSPLEAPAPALVLVPLDSAVSVFNEQYSARVECIVFTAGGVSLCVLASGDGSLGPLQNAEASTLTIHRLGGKPETLAPASWSGCETGDRVHCTLHYRTTALVQGATLSWSFGSAGYAAVELLDEGTLSKHPALSSMLTA